MRDNETSIRMTSYVHLPANTKVTAKIEAHGNGDRYIVLDLSAEGVGDVTLFVHHPEILDKLANECERVVREYVGDAPSQGYLDEIGEMQAAGAVR